MFKDFFVRSNYRSFIEDYKFLLSQKVNPEIYINSATLKNISQKELDKSIKILSNFSANTIHAPFLDISPGGFDKDIREISFKKLKKVLKIAKNWKSQLVVMHFNYDPIYYREYFDQWMENASDFFVDLIREKKSPRIIHCFDFGHHHVFGSIPFEEWLFYLKPNGRIHFHFHDNPGFTDDHLPVGEGSIDWNRVKEVILNMKVNFTVTLEPHSREDMIETINNYRKMFL